MTLAPVVVPVLQLPEQEQEIAGGHEPEELELKNEI